MTTLLAASAKGASFLILVQISSRALTFTINQILLRFLSPELLGASVQLELYSISVLYFARESLRVALQRQTGNSQALVNLSYISVALGLPIAYFFAALYARSSLAQVAWSRQSLTIYAFATSIELLAEPCFVVVQQKLLYKIRAAAETTATIARCLVTFIVVAWSHKNGKALGVLPFAFGQLSYTVCLFTIYYMQSVPISRRDKFALTPRKIPASKPSDYIASYFPRSICILSLNLYLQTAIKYVLTQGDSIIITSIATLHDQGTYALASNYGGLIARVLFQPIEESSRNLFAKLCAPRSSTNMKPTIEGLTRTNNTLRDILKFYNLLTLVSWAIGPALAPLLLQLVAGSKWSDTGASEVLATYCYYIPLLALNGVTEAFVAAVATNADLQRQSVFMGAYFVGFAGAAYLLLKIMALGAQGLVWANCLNMSFRIIWNAAFIKTFFARNEKHFDFQMTLPTIWSIAFAVCVAAIMRMPAAEWSPTLLEKLIRKGGVAAVFGLALLVAERAFIIQCYQLFTGSTGRSRTLQK